MTQALEGLEIIDLTRYAPGPYWMMIPGNLGVDIITIREARPPTAGSHEQAKVTADIQHTTEEILKELSYSPEDIRQLKTENIINNQYLISLTDIQRRNTIMEFHKKGGYCHV